jgi:hypothetical protein
MGPGGRFKGVKGMVQGGFKMVLGGWIIRFREEGRSVILMGVLKRTRVQKIFRFHQIKRVLRPL